MQKESRCSVQLVRLLQAVARCLHTWANMDQKFHLLGSSSGQGWPGWALVTLWNLYLLPSSLWEKMCVRMTVSAKVSKCVTMRQYEMRLKIVCALLKQVKEAWLLLWYNSAIQNDEVGCWQQCGSNGHKIVLRACIPERLNAPGGETWIKPRAMQLQ